jgi:hypothetical protein
MALPRALGLLASASFVAGALAACSGEDERPSGPAAGGTSGAGGSGASGGSAGSSGGSGGSAGSSGSSGSAGNAGTAGSSGAAGAAGAAGSGGSGSDGGPIDEACASNVAFWATGAAFVFPTAKALAQELSALTYDYNAHPLTVVLAAKPGGVGLVAVSATESGSGGPQVFPDGKKPALVTAAISSGGFATATAQTEGWLRVVDQSGPKDIALENVELTATTGGKCSTLSASVTAVIPASQGSLSLDLPSGAKTIAELAGGSSGGGQTPDGGAGYPLKLVFSGESTDFDFGSL